MKATEHAGKTYGGGATTPPGPLALRSGARQVPLLWLPPLPFLQQLLQQAKGHAERYVGGKAGREGRGKGRGKVGER